jgi:broad specificity phosphatase PhoE
MVEQIYIMRHGLTESNKKKIYAGWSDESICNEGISDLLEIGRKLKKFKIKKIFSSPIRRAIQTADIINGSLDVPTEIEQNLQEMKMGPWEGLSEEEVTKKFPREWKIWNSKPSELKLDGRETLRDLQLRTLRAIKKISNNSDFSRILAVTHVALIRALILFYNNLSLNDYRKINVPNGAVYLLDCNTPGKKVARVLL